MNTVYDLYFLNKVKNKFLLTVLLKLPVEVCVIRRNRLEKWKQVDKICCCVLLTSIYEKKN